MLVSYSLQVNYRKHSKEKLIQQGGALNPKAEEIKLKLQVAFQSDGADETIRGTGVLYPFSKRSS
jgi:hypothetical protein